jgi:hypothetical protein
LRQKYENVLSASAENLRQNEMLRAAYLGEPLTGLNSEASNHNIFISQIVRDYKTIRLRDDMSAGINFHENVT